MTRAGPFRTRMVLMIDPDHNPLDYPRTREVEPYPRRYAELTVPLSSGQTGTLRIPASLSVEEWDTMMQFLSVIRPGIVAHDD